MEPDGYQQEIRCRPRDGKEIGDTRTHITIVGIARVTRSVLAVMSPQTLGDQCVERLADEILWPVPEELRHRVIGETNAIAVVDDDQRVW